MIELDNKTTGLLQVFLTDFFSFQCCVHGWQVFLGDLQGVFRGDCFRNKSIRVLFFLYTIKEQQTNKITTPKKQQT